jgi:hypothetical protein
MTVKEASKAIFKVVGYAVIILVVVAFLTYVGIVIFGSFYNIYVEVNDQRLFYRTSCVKTDMHHIATNGLEALCNHAKRYNEGTVFHAFCYHVSENFWTMVGEAVLFCFDYMKIIGSMIGSLSTIFAIWKGVRMFTSM